MQTATAADLRNEFRRVSAWIDNGESVQITRGGVPFAILAPIPPHPDPSVTPKFDFAAARREIWGGRKFTAAEVKAMDDFLKEHDDC